VTAASGLAAVLFDMDGTLVDTERLWWDATAVVAESIGRPLVAADEPAVTGRPVSYTADYLLATSDTVTSLEALTKALEDAFALRVGEQMVPRPGALELLESLAEVGIPAAIVSASPRRVVDMVATSLGARFFATTVAVEDTDHSKPDPDPYELAAAIIGVAPGSCLAVEDTQIGTEAAEAAGCTVLVVPSEGQHVPVSDRRVFRPSLHGLTAGDLADLVS
jgi:HAD superfamily hydrolase (TIGR01509 family)